MLRVSSFQRGDLCQGRWVAACGDCYGWRRRPPRRRAEVSCRFGRGLLPIMDNALAEGSRFILTQVFEPLTVSHLPGCGRTPLTTVRSILESVSPASPSAFVIGMEDGACHSTRHRSGGNCRPKTAHPLAALPSGRDSYPPPSRIPRRYRRFRAIESLVRENQRIFVSERPAFLPAIMSKNNRCASAQRCGIKAPARRRRCPARFPRSCGFEEPLFSRRF